MDKTLVLMTGANFEAFQHEPDDNEHMEHALPTLTVVKDQGSEGWALMLYLLLSFEATNGREVLHISQRT